MSTEPAATFASGWLAPNLGARQAGVRIRLPAGTSLERFARNPIVLYGHDPERAVGTAVGLGIDDAGDLAATVDFAGANATDSGERAWQSVAATLTRLGEVQIQDGEIVELSLVPIARGAWPADDSSLSGERAQRTDCTPDSPCCQSGCALCEGVGRTDGDDDPSFCDCSSTPCECVRFDAQKETSMPTRTRDFTKDNDSHTDAIEDPEGHARRQMQLRNIQAGRRPFADAGRASSTAAVVRTDAIRDDAADLDRGIDIEARARREMQQRNIRRGREPFGGGNDPQAA